MIEEEFDFNRFNKNLATIDDKENYEPKTKFENEDQKIACNLSKIRCAFHDFYLDTNIITELKKKRFKKTLLAEL